MTDNKNYNQEPLKLAYKYYDLYDKNAGRQQKYFKRLQGLILILGVLVTLLALTQAQLLELKLFEHAYGDFWNEMLKYLIVLLPITIAAITSIANRFKEGNKWILLRAGAEAIKREMFRYRVYKNNPGIKPPENSTWEEKLAEKVNRVKDHIAKTEVNMMHLHKEKQKDKKKKKKKKNESPPPSENETEIPEEDLMLLEPNDYIEYRLENQYSFYLGKTEKLERKLKRLYYLIYIIGGFGTLLAAKGLELWVALTTTVAGTLTTYLHYQQVENTLMSYNQAATNLSNIKLWWVALSDEKKKKGNNIRNLVRKTETALQNELSGWVQQMEDVMADIYEKQTDEEPDAE